MTSDEMTKRIYVTDELHQALAIAKAMGGYRSLNNTIEDKLVLDDLHD